MTGTGPLRFPAAALAAAAVLTAACGKPEPPKVKEMTPLKAHETAKGLQEDLNRKAPENVDAIEKNAK